ncbi:hypothetical protein [Natrialbaceae archaeon AArc-T1-2]|uniref:hypothetical protein n=1 Tax=Natrialbaceae archaeon AArc-T1-2 TaxID=3053904 RepID=UPI00255AF2A3|nr:hypothetical protein [Natrialbaceae archaeon AArc-T1-2]WIV66232.1 hypothetical protein QQ977_11075 [Natrialbaceae archaeon AArc-T1-2]
MAIQFAETADPPGFQVHDAIEQRRVHVRTSARVSLSPADTDDFCFPVDTACSITTESLTFDQGYHVSIHDENGRWERTVESGDSASFERDELFVDLDGPIKFYCRVPGPCQIEAGITANRLQFERPTTVTIGARSHHERPASTIRTPDDPESILDAVSALSSALKATSPERSWPSLRGHPPLIERGETLEIPSDTSSPATDVTLGVPADYRHVYTVAPLSFYLGTTLRPAAEPVLETPRFERPIGDERRFEDDVARLLKRFFVLDCLVRGTGIYRIDFYERTGLADAVEFDIESTYDCPHPVRLERYLDVPWESIEPYVPQWPLTAHLPMEPESVELLPFIVNELGIVREPRGRTVERSVRANEASLTRSTRLDRDVPRPTDEADDVSFVIPDVNDEALEHAWFGDGVPQTASKATNASFRNQLERGERSETIEILLVCNDVRMLEEHDLLDETYGSRDALPFDVDSEFGASTDRLGTLLETDSYDFLHYVGHATPDGLECPDGTLDVCTLESIDVGVFFLNACQSYEQGLELVRQGAFGGVATVADVDNESAVESGETIARLLNLGFPLRAALEIARNHSTLGEEYLVVGDGSADIAQSAGGAPLVINLERASEDTFDVSVRSYPTKEYRLGTATASNLESVNDRHLTPNRTPAYRVSEQVLREYFTWAETPVLRDGELQWTTGLNPELLQ